MQGPKSAAWLVALLVACAAGYEGGRRAHPAVEPAAARREQADRERVDAELRAVLVAQAGLQAEVVALARIVRDDAHRGGVSAPAAAASPPAPTPAPAPAPRSVEALAAEDSARAVLDDATRAGRWTSADRDRLREALAVADDEGRGAVVRAFSVAVNTRRLALGDLQGPPL